MIDRNDPRLTAYALGEMDALERAEFEKLLAQDPAAKAEVEAIRAFGGRLSAELSRSTAPELTDSQRASVARAARRRVPFAVVTIAAAAGLALAVTAYFATRPATVHTEHARRSESETSTPRRASHEEVLAGGRKADETPASGLGVGASPGFRGPNGVVAPGARRTSETPDRLEGVVVQGDRVKEAVPVPAESEAKNEVVVVERGSGVPPPSDPAAPAEAPEVAPPAGTEGPRKKEEPLREGRANRRLVESSPIAGGGQGLMFEAAGAAPVDRIEFEKARRALPPADDREGYDRIRDNPFVRVAAEHTSTFSIDVDTASYANVRRFLAQEHRLPPPDAVRVEEMVNYFAYGYEPPAAGSPHPFRTHVEVAQCPWNAAHRLARVAIKGKVIDQRERPDSNLVFLVDVSGSMNRPNKLPLVQASLRMLAENLGERDRVAIVVYAGAAGLVLPSTGDKRQVVDAIGRLAAGGSTAGAAGIELAYEVAAGNFIKEGVNRVILCTDGDFNVGISDDGSLTRLIEEKAKTGVFLSVLGFGTGNYQDAKMQQLADKGNGNHAYIDSILEARKVLGEEMSATLVTIAKDVKIQVFFNPRTVAGYRLIGYENRLLAKQDFNDDTKDAGEIGAGHSVTALYELVPAGSDVPGAPPVDENPFVEKGETGEADAGGGPPDALFQLRLRYKQPDGEKSELLEQWVKDGGATFDGATPDFRWAAAVAAFGMNLRGTAGMGLDAVAEIAKGAAGDDKYRREFLDLVEASKLLTR